jgi:hypothetical protein
MISSPSTIPADRMERLDAALESVLILIAYEIGPVAMQAKVAGRVLAVARQVHGPAPEPRKGAR